MKTIAFAVIVWTAAFVSVAVRAQTAKSVNDGVYTAAQADRGTAVFKANCASCHETSRFTGSEFLPVWVGKSLFELYDVIHTTMPEDKPGSLKPQQYADVIAYFLKLNGYPTGETELAPDAPLKAITLDKKAK
jgi:S-disulfanyl-L-cysteine oxidoreductase SoxD